MKNYANSVRLKIPDSNVFDLGHDVKMSLNMGNLVPSMLMEVIPGDKIHIKHQMLLRFMPLVAPVMHRFDATIHTWFVPNRILWPNWEKFIQNDTEGGLPAFPYVSYVDGEAPTWSPSGLADYLGIPKPLAGGGQERVNALPFAAYQCIYDNWYRNTNVENPIEWQLVDGDNSSNGELFPLRRRCWETDYFTGVLPEAQRGPQVNIPVGGFKDVKVFTTPLTAGVGKTSVQFDAEANPGAVPINVDIDVEAADIEGTVPDLLAKTSDLEATQSSINDFREAMGLQKFFERLMRVGKRFKEYLLGVFGVQTQDSRLQVPEYVCGVKQAVTISEVLNTTGEDGGLPQGNMAGHGIAVLDGDKDHFFVPEHGFIISILSVRPKTAYQQGLAKHWLKTVDFTDYFTPDLAHLGEQPVLKKELYAFQGEAGGDEFGYNPVYSDYRVIPNRVAGDLRGNLDDWHAGRIFDTPPSFNTDFVLCSPDNRIFAVTDEDTDHLIAHVYNDVKAVRKIPMFGTPAI